MPSGPVYCSYTSPRVYLQSVDDVDHLGIVAEGKPGPGVDDLGGGEVRIPGQLAEAVEVGHRQGCAASCVEANIGHADEAAQRPVKALALDNFA